MKTITVLLALFALPSCIATPKTEFMKPHGKIIYTITYKTADNCEQEARELCPNQYDNAPVASGANDTSARGGIGDTPVRRMAIECK